jgi:hypothetical protein
VLGAVKKEGTKNMLEPRSAVFNGTSVIAVGQSAQSTGRSADCYQSHHPLLSRPLQHMRYYLNPNSLKMNAPSFRRRPLFVNGMPIALEILDLNAETPINLQIEKPPRFKG